MTNFQPTLKSTTKPKNNTIQIFRALAIIAVVMIHTCPPGEWQVFCRPFINFSVATFLFLSGYLTKIQNNNWNSFFKKRIIRVIIPYFIWTILYSIAFYNRSLDKIFINLLTAQAAAPLYYIFVYIQFVLLTPILGKLAKSKYHYLGWLITPISILIFKYFELLTDIKLNGYVNLIWSDSCLGWFSFYYLGLMLGNRLLQKNYSLISLSVIYVISIILQIIEGHDWFLLGEANCGTQLKLTSIITSTIFVLIVYTILTKHDVDIKNKFFCLLGDYSFGIYLCHIMIMFIIGRVPYYNTIPFPINSILVVLLSFCFCYIGNKICGRKFSSWIGLR